MTSLNSHAKDLARFWKGKILWDSPMSKFSSLKVGGPAEAIVAPANTGELQRLIRWLGENGITWRVVGKGSNILVPDSGLAGVTIVLGGEFTDVAKKSSTAAVPEAEIVLVRVGSACLLSRLVNYCTAEGLTGLEFTIGIPGSVGGAIVMNAGAWGNEIGSHVEAVSLMDSTGKIFSAQATNLGFLYREWSMPKNTILLTATFRLKPGSKEEIKAACRKYVELRRTNQPIADPSVGSFFKNPPMDYAGRLIDEAGLKGFSIGGAKVSEKHANFIVNTGTASATDILKLMAAVQQEVYRRFGVKLEPEVHILERE